MWKITKDGILIPIKVTPKASKNAIVGWENGELKIRIAAIPAKGNANQELIAFLAKELQTNKSNIQLISGESSRHKRVLISNIEPPQIWFL